ncbi:MAG: aspartyl beta-hydroxylase [Gammaproteobacteria bacterium]|nr:aspartyl beta-hydroxylase [Gammaproteobacteria bacterium]
MNTPNAAGIPAMAQQARELTRVGRALEAAQLWQRILAVDPNHTESLLALAIQALARRDAASALSMLQHAATTATRDPMVALYMALALKELGRPDEEMVAVTQALTIDPYFFPALLHKAMLLERLGKRRQAASVFRDVLKIMPAAETLTDGYQRAVTHAQAAVAENQQSLGQHLAGVLSSLRKSHSGQRLDRFERTVDVLLGRKKMYHPEPIMLHYADLAPIQFYDRELFPWLGDLEAQSDAIREELLGVLADSREEFRPYIQYPPGAPVNQWVELNYSPRWSTYFLWDSGRRVDEHCERCPKTAAVLETLPLAQIPNFSPTVVFSLLEPRTVIPAHTGETNTRALVHLPLIVPPGCSFRVGHVVREWVYGEAFAFDDSIEHEARNDSDQLRAIMILDVWNPALTAAERELVAALVNGVREYYRAEA